MSKSSQASSTESQRQGNSYCVYGDIEAPAALEKSAQGSLVTELG